MPVGRAILVALLVFSVAILPIAGSVAHAASSTVVSLTSPDCCPHDKTCDKQMPLNCDLSGACVAKCFSPSATVVAAPQLTGMVLASQKPVLSGEAFHAGSQSPPLPPPRL